MKFNHLVLDKSLEWREDRHISELVVESPVFMRKLISDLSSSYSDGALVFTDGDEILSIDKDIDVVFNPLKLSFNNRRCMTTLLKVLVRASTSEEFYMSTNKFKTEIIKYLSELIDSENYAFEVDTDNFGVDAIAKAVNMHIVSDEDDFVELLTDYMSMMSELVFIKLFVFVNLRSILEDHELKRLIDNANNHQINILLVENRDYGKIKNSDRILVDRDLCEI